MHEITVASSSSKAKRNRSVVARSRILALAQALLCAAGFATARPAAATDDFADAATSEIAYTHLLASPRIACASLAGRKLTSTVVIREAKAYAAKGSTPAFCDVQGTVDPSIAFDVALPLAWNERLYALGNSGCGGVLSDNFGDRNIGLANGFAVASTNTGIENPSGTCAWAKNEPDRVVDFAYTGIHDTAVVAKDLLQLFYARSPVASYYNGCSDGGHDGLEEVERFPDDYDGVVAGAPFLGAGTVIAGAWTAQAFAALPADEAMTPAKVNYVASAIYAACDGLDGLKDGIIANPQACASAFDPKRDLAVCASGTNGNGCLTPDQLAAYVKAVGPVMSEGKPFYPGLPLGSEIEFSGNQVAATRSPRQDTLGFELSNTFMQYLFPWPKTAPDEFNVASFDFDTGPSSIKPFREMFDPTNTNMNAFFERGGKLLAYHGLADPLISAYGTVAFFEDESAAIGSSIDTKFTFYAVPGMGHCAGGPGADAFDPMTKIVNWVEGRRVPGPILSRHFDSSGRLSFTRTLCPYPEIGSYAGSEPKSAASFVCTRGPTGVPGMGAGGGLQLP
jgi:feruloyl esterase